jgi:MYXO-CTERM domain-containing protein
VVDVLDAANVLSGRRFDSGEAAIWSEGDFTHDGSVDVLDAAEFLSAGLFDAGGYLPSPLAVAPVPEPAGSWAAVGLAAAALLVRRRR